MAYWKHGLIIALAMLTAACSTGIGELAAHDKALRYSEQGFNALDDGDQDTALSKFDSAIEAEPDNEILYYNRGLLYFELEDFELAEDDFTSAANLDPYNPLPFFWRARSLDEMGDTQDAIDDYQYFVRIYPEEDEMKRYARRRSLGLFLDDLDLEAPGVAEYE